MQRTIAMALVLTLAVIGTGCTKSKGGMPSQQPELRRQPAWTLTLNSACASYVDEYCVARHGFKATADGTFEIGPGPQGQVKTGKLEAEELAQLETLVRDLSGASALTGRDAESCVDFEEFVPDSQDRITFTRNGTELTLYRTEEARTCYQGLSRETNDQLHHAIRTLADKYYALPFPDTCAEAADAIHNRYAPVQGCATDNDCAYITESYEVIPSSANQYVITDNCSMIPPLVVGNAKLVETAKAELLESLLAAQNVCGQRIIRNDCLGIAGFESSLGAPVCQQGVCRVHPNATPLR
ncbi:MAG: hypothetical protein NDJ90_05830 [Oligoflexia bacterium]|nr:hypothetical protein [Oligoflexia bacterium]